MDKLDLNKRFNVRTKAQWNRFRFNTYSVADYRPLVYDPRYPWWCSGLGDGYAVIIAYLPEGESLDKYWDDAFDVTVELKDEITFSDRFPKPEYFVEMSSRLMDKSDELRDV